MSSIPSDSFFVHDASDLGDVPWESRWSGSSGGNCVEVAPLPDGRIAVRQSKAPGGPALIYTPAEMTAFIGGVKDGMADHLVPGQ